MVTPNRDTIDTGRAAAPRIREFRESPAARQAEAPDRSPAIQQNARNKKQYLRHQAGYLLWYGISRGVHGTGITEPLLNTLILYSRIYKNSSCF